MLSDKRKLPERNEFFFTNTGFGVKRISRETVENNFEKIRQIAEEGEKRISGDEDAEPENSN